MATELVAKRMAYPAGSETGSGFSCRYRAGDSNHRTEQADPDNWYGP